jgi:hypothetical protein
VNPPVDASSSQEILRDVSANANVLAGIANVRRRLEHRGINISISGVDGCGKSTLSQQLVTVFSATGVRVRRLHCYRWYTNLFVVPWLLLVNRYLGRELIVFDRSIADNISVFFVSRRRGLLPVGAALVAALYPSFDHSFYLTAPAEEIRRRRPGSRPEAIAQMEKNYRAIMRSIPHIELTSNEELLRAVLSRVAAATR